MSNPSPSKTLRSLAAATSAILALTIVWPVQTTWAKPSPDDQATTGKLKQLSLEELGSVEVTTASKEPEQVWRTPAAIYVITQEDIRRSGATSCRKSFGWLPEWKLPALIPITGRSASAGLVPSSRNLCWS